MDKVNDFLKKYFDNNGANILFFIGFFLLMLWMPLEYGARYINTQVAGQIICGGLILLLLREKNNILYKFPLWAISVFWIFILILSFSFSIAKLASLEELMRNILYISLSMVIFSWCNNQDRVKLFSYTIILTGVIVSLIGIIVVLRDYIVLGEFVRASSPLGRTNDLGAYLLLIFPLSFSNFLYEEDSNIEKALYGLSAILSFIAIIFTFSRGIWLSLLISLFLLFLLGRKILRKNLIYIGIICIIFLIPIIYSWEDIVSRFLSLQNIFTQAENSIEWRKSLLRGSLQIFADNPLIGTGLNTFPFIYYYYQEQAGYFSINPHNYYLQLLTETGIIGFLAFIIFALSILYLSFKAFSNSEKIFKGIALGLLVGIISSLIHISVDIDWSVSSIPILFWTQVGLLMSIYNLVNFRDTRFSKFNDRFNYIKRPVLFIISFALLIIPTTNYISLMYYSKAVKYLNTKQIDESEKEIKKAILFSPWDSAKHHDTYAKILSLKGDMNKALEMSKHSIELDVFNYRYYKTYADLLIKKSNSNKKEALETLIKATVINPYTHPKIYEYVGDLYVEEFKNIKEAIFWYKEGLNNFPLSTLSRYETYSPDDRYQLYRINIKLSKLYENIDKEKSKEYKQVAEYILTTQPVISSIHLGKDTATPTSVIKSYWTNFNKSNEEELKKYTIPESNITHPPFSFNAKFINFVNIEHNIYNVRIEYKIHIKVNNEEKIVTLIDEVIPTREGWIIKERVIKD